MCALGGVTYDRPSHTVAEDAQCGRRKTLERVGGGNLFVSGGTATCRIDSQAVGAWTVMAASVLPGARVAQA